MYLVSFKFSFDFFDNDHIHNFKIYANDLSSVLDIMSDILSNSDEKYLTIQVIKDEQE